MENPYYRERQGWHLEGRRLVAWNLFLALLLAGLLLTGHFVIATVFVAVWVLAEILRRRDAAKAP